MGCCASRSHLETVDDSVHVMLQHDKKVAQRKGETPKGYVPRAPHPLLQPKNEITATEEDDENPETKTNKTEPSEENKDDKKEASEEEEAQPSAE